MTLDPATEKNVKAWLSPSFDEKTRLEIERLAKEEPEELTNAFYTHMSFGTGGLRGLMGIGTNRMNNYTVSFATQGLANYLKKSFPHQELSVFIGYDCRNHSREFAETAASVLAGNGIKAYLSKELCTTPFTSFCCRHLKTQAAIMVTASHNPPAYNGYKVYWQDGGQVLPPHDIGIVKEANQITTPEQVKKAPLNSPLIEERYEEEKRAYIKALHGLQLLSNAEGEKIHIVYSPLHGTGIQFVPDVLKDWGFTNVTYVEEQKKADGNFPTCPFPNPEETETMALGVKYLQKLQADIFIATDPDADRMRAIIWHQKQPVWLNGNQLACIMLYHVLQNMNPLPKGAAFIKTIVTTELFRKITEGFNRPTYDVLTGFKYIAQLIHEWEGTDKHYIFGGEESYGTLLGTIARDKDAVIATALISEAALAASLAGKTLIDLLHDIYKRFGLYGEALVSLTFPETKEGKDSIARAISRLRTSPPKELLGQKVSRIADYQTSEELDLERGKKSPITLPKSDVIQLFLQDGSKVTLRPSGTEPKIKLYAEVPLPVIDSVDATLKKAEKRCQDLLKALQTLICQ